MPQTVRLADDVGVQCHAHYEWAGLGEFQHLVELVDDDVGELRRTVLASHDRGNVVRLLGIGHREKAPAVAAPEPDRLIVHAPVELVAIAGLGQKIWRAVALRDPRSQPALRRRPFLACQAGRGPGDQTPLRRLVQNALPLGVGATMTDDFVTPCTAGCHELRGIVVHRAVHQRGHRQVERVEGIEHVPGAHAVAPVAPREVEDIGLWPARGQLRAEPLAKAEMLEVQGEVHGQSAIARPDVVLPPPKRHVVISIVGR